MIDLSATVSNFDPLGGVELIDLMGDDLSIIRAARVSYGRGVGEEFDAIKDGKLLRYLLKNGHWSPFEHATLTFRVECPIFVARQWMRHKSWSFNEYSARYKEVEDRFYSPEAWRKQSKSNKQASDGFLGEKDSKMASFIFEDALQISWGAYQRLLRMGVAREQARSILPVGSFTEFYATASVRSILHFLDQRDDSHAQYEIRELAKQVKEITKQYFPHTILAWEDLRAGVDSPKVSESDTEGERGVQLSSPSTKEFQEGIAFV